MPPLQHLLDDLDNCGGWRRLVYMGDLGELTFRYESAVMNHKPNTTFGSSATSCTLPGCRALPFTTAADRPPGLTRSIARCRLPITQACAPALLNACSSSTATWGLCSETRINRPARVCCKMPPAKVRAFVPELHGGKWRALICVSM
jgi:hypothetical protein